MKYTLNQRYAFSGRVLYFRVHQESHLTILSNASGLFIGIIFRRTVHAITHGNFKIYKYNAPKGGGECKVAGKLFFPNTITHSPTCHHTTKRNFDKSVLQITVSENVMTVMKLTNDVSFFGFFHEKHIILPFEKFVCGYDAFEKDKQIGYSTIVLSKNNMH